MPTRISLYRHGHHRAQTEKRLAQADLLASRMQLVLAAGIHGVVAVPIVDQGEVLAVILFTALRAIEQQDEIMLLLTTALQQIAPLIRRTQAMDALSVSESKFRSLLEASDAVVFMIDDEGRFLYANQLAARPYGLTPEEMIGRRVADLFAAEGAQKTLADVRTVIETGEGITHEPSVDLPTGRRWYRSSVQPMRNAEGKTYAAVISALEITEFKQTSLALRRSEARYRQIVETAHEGIWLADLTGKTLFANRRMAEMLGYTTAEMQDRSIFDFIPEETHRITLQRLEHRRQGVAEQHESLFKRKDGTDLWTSVSATPLLNEDGQPVATLAMLSDVTGRRQAEIAAAQTLTRLHALHAIDQSILHADTPAATADEALRNLESLLPAQSATVLEINEVGGQARILAMRLQERDPGMNVGDTFAIEESVLVGLQHQRFLIIKGLDQHDTATAKVLYAQGIRSILSIGLKQEGHLIGAFNLHAASDDFFEKNDIQIPLEIADQLAIAIHTARLNEQIRQNTLDLEERITQRTAELQREKERTMVLLKQAQESEERYRTTIATMSEGIVLQDNTGAIQIVNEAAERALGMSAEQMMGRTSVDPSWRAIHEDGSPFPGETHPAMVTLRTGKPQSNVVMGVYKPTGEIGWIQVNSRPLQKPDEALPHAVVVTFSDITEMKRAEAVIKESEQKYRSLVESMQEGLTTTDSEDRFVYVNNRFCEILGYTYDELIGTQPTDYLILSSVETARAQLSRRRKFDNGAYEVLAQHKDGQPINLLISAAPLIGVDLTYQGSTAVITDITAQIQREDSLRQLTQRLQLATEAGGIGIWEWDSQSNVMTWDDQMYALYAVHSAGDARHLTHFWESGILHPDDLEPLAPSSANS
ncbi:MAG: PAS domain S-box protein [Caldilineaceae bacterium]